MDFFARLFKKKKEEPECDIDSVEMASVMSTRQRPATRGRAQSVPHAPSKDSDNECYNDKLHRTLKKSTRRKYKRRRKTRRT